MESLGGLSAYDSVDAVAFCGNYDATGRHLGWTVRGAVPGQTTGYASASAVSRLGDRLREFVFDVVDPVEVCL